MAIRPIWEERPTDIINAINRNCGILTRVAEELGIDLWLVREAIRQNPDIAKAHREVKDTALDLAESSLLEAIADREPWAIQFYLRTIGSERGFGDQMTLNLQRKIDELGIDVDRIALDVAEKLQIEDKNGISAQ